MNLLIQFPLEIDERGSGKRVDRFLSDLAVGVSRNHIAMLLQSGKLLVNEKVVKPSYKLRIGDCLTLEGKVVGARAATVESSVYRGPPVEILYEDESLVVVNKPEGLVVHPGSGVSLSETLAGWLQLEKGVSGDLSWLAEHKTEGRIGVVHRLDKGTSGALVLAKNPETHEKLSNLFLEHKIHRVYWALLEGNLEKRLEKRTSKVDGYLMKGWVGLKRDENRMWSLATYHGRDPKNPLRYCVDKEGKKAISSFVCRGARDEDSFVELKLATGRTHQIRVQMAFLGCPVMGDVLYGGREAARIFLHAFHLSFPHPWHSQRVSVEARSRSFESFSKILGYRPQDYKSDQFFVAKE